MTKRVNGFMIINYLINWPCEKFKVSLFHFLNNIVTLFCNKGDSVLQVGVSE